ncbi:hypothetical protein PoB_004569500 [Plakobranchus ocellatus]|uniref:Uncharacterized protein n=1 Tax=Plakobranchus ocellatus TaxID=259542 RepID=A0AAV4BI52_9GAST|nr:hypothetical protein PoB_004569500 [Plakobranchus ocellatus]
MPVYTTPIAREALAKYSPCGIIEMPVYTTPIARAALAKYSPCGIIDMPVYTTPIARAALAKKLPEQEVGEEFGLTRLIGADGRGQLFGLAVFTFVSSFGFSVGFLLARAAGVEVEVEGMGGERGHLAGTEDSLDVDNSLTNVMFESPDNRADRREQLAVLVTGDV